MRNAQARGPDHISQQTNTYTMGTKCKEKKEYFTKYVNKKFKIKRFCAKYVNLLKSENLNKNVWCQLSENGLEARTNSWNKSCIHPIHLEAFWHQHLSWISQIKKYANTYSTLVIATFPSVWLGELLPGVIHIYSISTKNYTIFLSYQRTECKHHKIFPSFEE